MRTKLLILTVGLALTFTACSPPGNSTAAGTTSSDVNVTQLFDADQSAPCRDAKSALSPHATSTSTTFVLTIDVNAPLCTPVSAKAVVYAMPGNGVAWPQQLVKVVPFTISQAGTVTVTFEKGCGAAQFDVLTGATPQTINNGLEHGPLLFQDVNTAQQYWGAPCSDVTTTTSDPTTTLVTTTTEDPTTTTTEPPTTTSTTTTTTTTEPPTTTSTTTTTTAPPLPVLEYTGVADKFLGCYSGAAGDDTFHQVLGSDGYWDFYFQGCSLFSTETVALDDPPGGPFANAFEAPTGYECKFSIDGTSDGTGYYTTQVGTVADTGGLIFLESSSEWSSPTTWRITCIPV